MERSYADATFDELSLLITDPLVESIKDRAREVASLLNDTSPTPGDIRDLTHELDVMWPHSGKTVGITGNIKYRDRASGELTTAYFEDTRMVSNGFYFEPIVIEIEGEGVATYYEPRYHLLYTHQDEDSEGDTTMVCAAGIDDVFIDFPSESMGLIEGRLRHFHPATMETVDMLLLNAENEDDATQKLTDIELIIDTSDINDLQLVSDLQHYITHLMEYDVELPYMISAVDRFFIQEGNDVRALGKGSAISGFFWPGRIQFLPSRENEEESAGQRLVACIEGVYMGETRGQNYQIYLDPNYLTQFNSIRGEA